MPAGLLPLASIPNPTSLHHLRPLPEGAKGGNNRLLELGRGCKGDRAGFEFGFATGTGVSSMQCSGRRSASVTVPAASLSGTVQVVSSKRRVLLASVHFILEGSRVHARVTLIPRVDIFIGNSARQFPRLRKDSHMSIWTILFVILLIAWIGGFTVFHAAGGLIHLLLVFAVISLILHFVLGTRRTV